MKRYEKQEIYDLLEDKMLNYTDYINVPVELSNDPFVPIPTSENLIARQIGENMRPYTGEQIFVRQQVVERLTQAAAFLTECNSNLQLEVVYGYRAFEIQTRLFEAAKQRLGIQFPDLEDERLLARTHKDIAIPEVAGHPTGGAIDLQIIRKQDGQPLDFGTKIWEFQSDSFTFSPFISKEGWRNRQLLRGAMINAGFAPFDGEWWHFSYGDKEWARYYDRPAALYEQVQFNAMKGKS